MKKRRGAKKRMDSYILGIIGEIGGGKGTAAKYLRDKYGFHIIGMGDMIRREAVERGLDTGRETTQKLSTDLRAKYGQDYFCKKALDMVHTKKIERTVIDGIRSKVETDFWKKSVPYFKMIYIYATNEARFKRLQERGGPKAPKTWTEFLEHEKREEKLYPGSLAKFLALADYKIDNSSAKKELQKNLDKLMQKLKISKK